MAGQTVCRRVACTLAMIAATALYGCGGALESRPLDLSSYSADDGVCDSQFGVYALPKDLIYLEIDKVDGDPNYYEAQGLTTHRTADNHTYCLDFVGSPLSADRVAVGHVETGPGAGLLLTAIGSEFDDKSLQIAEAVVEGVARLAVAPRGGFGVKDAKKYLVGQYEFDPFDKAWITKINAALEPLRHCVFIDPTDDPYVPAWQLEQCHGYAVPQSAARDDYYGLSVIAKEPPSRAAARPGVLYRPVLTHKLVIMRKTDEPTGPAWKVFQTQRVEMTNAAPALLLEVNRSLFVQRTGTIKFDSGVLTSVNLTKPSQAEALSGFILRAVQTVVAIPVRALVLRKSDAANRKELISAQGQLIATMRQYNAAVAAEKAKREAEAIQPTGTARSSVPIAQVANGDRTTFDECVNTYAAFRTDVSALCSELIQTGGSLPQ